MRKYDYSRLINHEFDDKSELPSTLKVRSTHIIENPDLCIMIPAYGREETLKQTIESVVSQDTSYSFLVIVVDDDPSASSIITYMEHLTQCYPNILYYKNSQNLGQAANWNRCISLCRSKWCVILHDDDTLEPNYVQTVMKYANKYNDVSSIGVFQNKIDYLHDECSFNTRQSKAQRILCFLRKGKPFIIYPRDIIQFIFPSPGCWFFDSRKAYTMGGFDSTFEETLDGIFHAQNILLGKTIIVPRFLMNRRIDKNIFLQTKAQMNVINMLYYLGKTIIFEYLPIKKARINNFVLEIAFIHLVNGIKEKYNATFDVDGILSQYHIHPFLRNRSSHTISFINNCLLIKLVFRKMYE